GPLEERLRFHRDRFRATYEPKEIEQWHAAASAATAQRRGRDALVDIQRRFGRAVETLVEGAGAEARLGQVVYLPALCKQEQAERLRLRLDHSPAEARDRDYADAEGFWKEARHLWAAFLGEFERSPAGESASAFRARAQQMLGAVAERRAARAPAATRA